MIHARPDYNRFQDPEGKIKEDEPVFLLRAQDYFFIGMLKEYRRRANAHMMYDMVQAVDEHIKRSEEWRRNNEVKLPDL